MKKSNTEKNEAFVSIWTFAGLSQDVIKRRGPVGKTEWLTFT